LNVQKIYKMMNPHLMCKCYKRKLKLDQSQNLILIKLLGDLKVLRRSNKYSLILHFRFVTLLKTLDMYVQIKNKYFKKIPI